VFNKQNFVTGTPNTAIPTSSSDKGARWVFLLLLQDPNQMALAKRVGDWTPQELINYRITVTAQTPQQFFGRNGANPPLENILDFSLVNSAPYANDLPDDIFHYLTLLDLATSGGGQDYIFNDFSRETLRVLGFVERGLALNTGYDIPLRSAAAADYGTNSGFIFSRARAPKPTPPDPVAQTDVCLFDGWRSMVLLVLQTDKTRANPTATTGQPEPRMIAGAIAAYQNNNRMREARGMPAIDRMTIPCISMSGTQPTFYLVPVSSELNIAVMSGRNPYTATNVTKCVTTFGPHGRFREGMETTEYRRLAFQRFIAFRGLAKEYWQGFWQTPQQVDQKPR
jgi:hypothetical protein